MKKRWKKYIYGLIIVLGIFIVIFGVIVSMHFKDDFLAGKSFSRYNLPYSVIFLDRNDKEIYRSFDDQNREWTSMDTIAQSLKDVTLLAEDKRFYDHFGVDVRGISRAIIANWQAGRVVQGGSTLTQQIAKKAFLSDERTLERKAREAFIALGIESQMSKKEIFEMYLNMAPYGATLSGVKSSAKFYFNKKPIDLSLAESLVLAMLPQNPVILSRTRNIKDWLGECSQELVIFCSPLSDESYKRTRIEEILFEYAANNNFSDQKTEETWRELYEMTLPERKNWIYSDFQHFRFYVKKFLTQNEVNLIDYPGGLIVKTSIDRDLQIATSQFMREEAIEQLDAEFAAKNTAILVLEHENRGPLVWVGSVDYWDQEINGQVDMLQSRRQVGSTIKPFIYSAMFEQGFTPQTIMWDTRVRFNSESKIIRNSDGRYMGAIPVQTALATSRNVPAAQALYISGGETAMKNYLDRSFGFNINKNYPDHPFGWTLSLGTAPIRLMDLANGYAALGTGKKQSICPILSIKSTTGEVIPNICDKNSKNFVKSDARFFVNSTLSNELLRPAGTWRKNLTVANANIASKSGTSTTRIRGQEYPIDNFVVGYTPDMTILSWTGNANGKPLNTGSFGTLSIGPYWNQIARGVFESYPELATDFVPPQNVIKNNGFWTRIDQDPAKYSIPSMSFVSQEENAQKKLLLQELSQKE